MTKSKITKLDSEETWNNYWEEFVSEQNSVPTVRWRCRILINLIKKLSVSLPSHHIIDFGSGPGLLLRKLTDIFPQSYFTGLEQSESAISYASSQYSQTPIQYIQVNLLSSTDTKIDTSIKGDLCICTEVLEHIEETDIFLKNCCNYMTPNSTFIVTVPGGPQTAFSRHLGHVQHYTPERLKSILELYFQKVECYDAGFPFYNLYQICSYILGKKLVENCSIKKSKLLLLGTTIFNWLFYLNLSKTHLGWQTIGIARNPKQKSNE